MNFRAGSSGRAVKRPVVVLADDHVLVLEGIRKLLEPHFEVGACVQDGRELLAAAATSRPDVILLDISMPGLNGVEAALQLRKDAPQAKLIFLTMHSDPAFLGAALRAGAHGYVLKRCASAELVNAIRQVIRGKTYITPEVAGDFPRALASGTPLGQLTTREREVLQLVAEGKAGKEIATAMKISPKTVAFHKSNIMSKLNIRTTAGLTQFAVRHGVVAE